MYSCTCGEKGFREGIMADDRLEDWIIGGELEKELQAQIVPSSTSRLAEGQPADGETSMTTVAAWMSAKPQLPIVELATLSPRAITLTFHENVTLPEPWVSQAGDPEEPHDQWGITHQDAQHLPQGDSYGWQMSSLTGLGTLIDGSRALVNTVLWEVLQIAGEPAWTRDLMITQVMSQAAEPWSDNHDIWLVGFDETADKLMNFLINEHPRHRFKTADSIADIHPQDLHKSAATIYVLGAGEGTLDEFAALNSSDVGLVVDTIITDEAMFITERDDGSAVLGPFSTNLELWPNLQRALIEKMEYAWQATEEIARQRAAELDFDELLNSADVHPDEPPHDESRQPSSEADSEESVQWDRQKDSTETQSSPTIPEPNEEVEHSATSVHAESPITEPSEKQHELEVNLQLFGTVSAETREKSVTGRHAETLAILYLEQGPISPQKISELLWPGDDPQGHTARTRRSRLKAKIEEHFGPIISTSDDGWSVETDRVATDFDTVLKQLKDADPEDTEAINNVCQNISIPLETAESWSQEYRDVLKAELIEALTALKNKAVEAENYDAAKTVKSTTTRIGVN